LYNVLIVDPPWQYRKPQTGGSLKSGASQKYNVIEYQDLVNLIDDIEPVIDKNCILFLWATNPFIDEALDLVKNWGFTYKTLVTWVKPYIGLGYYFRGVTEHMLVGTRGKVKAIRCQKPNTVYSKKKLLHSEKPIESYELIDEATKKIPNRKVLELFARRPYKDWTCIGNEITGNDIREDLKMIGNLPFT
jgi:N6-adenosine-specific RNA methylase IME4